ncbi:hypothetical protein [Bythopirellula polymerisocia]|uniref:Uncharacterized protein n=1 Tax=Bythopirellula polymerisocia TaxID=2528003 RepID=A0A5C6CK85_9BACT|nr:hypothetical protein [Bythopirellula polymerisocia]TWU23711.1 hypothetical protein Pla144_38860 [Bythopirellula polymerisocia]
MRAPKTDAPGRIEILDRALLSSLRYIVLTILAGFIVEFLLPNNAARFIQQLLATTLAIGSVLITIGSGVALLCSVGKGLFRYRIKDMLIITTAVAAVAAVYAVLGLRWTATIAAFLLTFAAPFVVVLMVGPFPTTAAAAKRGAAMSIVSCIVSWILYLLLIGSKSSYIVAAIGPGLRNFNEIGLGLFLSIIFVWPLCVLMLGGAVAGVVGQLLRKHLEYKALTCPLQSRLPLNG